MSTTTPAPGTPRAFLAAREEASRRLYRDRLARVREQLQVLAQTLFALGASRVWVFGSVVHSRDGGFDEGSDLDLAVEGLPSKFFIDARVALAEHSPIPFDLVELERAPPSLRDVILTEGEELPRHE